MQLSHQPIKFEIGRVRKHKNKSITRKTDSKKDLWADPGMKDKSSLIDTSKRVAAAVSVKNHQKNNIDYIR
jgi:hypothetical protein